MRNYPKVKVTAKAENSIRLGHPWVYGEEITARAGEFVNGELVDVHTSKDKYLGTGLYNDNSKIAVRILSRNTNDRFDSTFFMRRIKYAIDYRRRVMGEDFSNCRLIFGEADQFPGLTVDRFENVLVVQILSLGMEKRKDILLAMLVKAMADVGVKIDVVYERSESSLRQKEGLEPYKGFYEMEGLRSDTDGHVTIRENGILYDVDYIEGQKTGFFLDQKYNRQAVARIAGDMKVLDCFTHTGSFALNAAAAGAERVCAVDVTEYALQIAAKNAKMNELTNVEFVQADVFAYLDGLAASKKSDYDLIILDPPAFTKSSGTVANASRGYLDINQRAMKLLPRGGFLATCSCSHFMTDTLFVKMLKQAAQLADVSLRQVEARQQSQDHPILWNVPETDYLKFYIFQIV